MSVFIVFYLFYFLLGPLAGQFQDQSFYVGRSFQRELALGWYAGAVAVLCHALGYGLIPASTRVRVPVVLPEASQNNLRAYAFVLIGVAAIGCFLWLSITEIALNPFGSEADEVDSEYRGEVRVNYLYHLIDLFIPGLLLLYATDHKRLVVFTSILLPVVILYAAVGFRYRLWILLIGLYALHHILKKSPARLVPILLATAALVLFMGAVGEFRDYYSGLKIASTDEYSLVTIALATLRETNIFYAFCSILHSVPEHFDFALFAPILYVFTLPIPRSLWPGKPSPEYLTTIPKSLGTDDAWYAGTALPAIGEYFLAFGWVGLVLGSIALGMIAKVIWLKFKEYQEDVRWQAIYALTFGFLFYVLSRGYTGQIVQDFVFVMAPILPILLLNRSKKTFRAAANSY